MGLSFLFFCKKNGFNIKFKDIFYIFYFSLRRGFFVEAKA